MHNHPWEVKAERWLDAFVSADLKNDHSNKDCPPFVPPENFRNHQNELSKKNFEHTFGLGDTNSAQYSNSWVHLKHSYAIQTIQAQLDK